MDDVHQTVINIVELQQSQLCGCCFVFFDVGEEGESDKAGWIVWEESAPLQCSYL